MFGYLIFLVSLRFAEQNRNNIILEQSFCFRKINTVGIPIVPT